MEVVILHDEKEWKILPISRDYTLNSFNSKIEARLCANQNNYEIKSYECNNNCNYCKLRS